FQTGAASMREPLRLLVAGASLLLSAAPVVAGNPPLYPRPLVLVPFDAGSLVALDANGDGLLDIALARAPASAASAAALVLFEAAPGLAFSPAQAIAIDLDAPLLATGDMDSDGVADLVAVQDKHCEILNGSAEGGFGAARTVALPAKAGV